MFLLRFSEVSLVLCFIWLLWTSLGGGFAGSSGWWCDVRHGCQMHVLAVGEAVNRLDGGIDFTQVPILALDMKDW
jgi:hypothetical protein